MLKVMVPGQVEGEVNKVLSEDQAHDVVVTYQKQQNRRENR